MRRVGILLGFILIATILVRVNIINTNRLISDSITFTERQLNSSIGLKISQVEVKAKRDLYSDPEGYSDEEGIIHVESHTQETPSQIKIIPFHDFITTEPLFVRTDNGCQLTLPFENFQWKYDKNLVGWDGESITLPKKEEGIKYILYRLNVSSGDNEMVRNIYSLDYYEDVSPDEYDSDLQGYVGILVKLRDNAVERYTILNSVIEDYDWAYVYNLQGKEIMEVRRDFIHESLQVGSTGVYELVSGHSIKVDMENPEEISGEFKNHRLVQIVSDIHDGVVSEGVEDMQLYMGPGIGEVELSIFGTDLFSIEILYTRQLR